MDSPSASTTTWLLAAGGAVGLTIKAAIGALWRSGNKGRDDLILELRTDKAVLSADVVRIRDERDVLGRKYDAKCEELKKMSELFAAHVERTGDYGDIPSKVHNLAATFDPGKPTPR